MLSIIWRELTVGARQSSTHRGRLIAGAVVVGLFTLFLAVQNNPPNVLGMMIFSIASALLFLQALTAGLRYTADSLSEEKRDGTLGLLFLTELKSFEIVLGKMVARSLRGFYGMIATLPILTFCILLGGIRGMDTLNMAILLIATMLYSLAAGMFISSLTTEDKTAFLGTIGFLIALSVIPPIVWKICAGLTKSSAFDFILYASPFYGFHTMPRVSIYNGEFAKAIAGLVALTVAFLALAARNVKISFKRDVAEPLELSAEQQFVHRVVHRHNSGAALEANPFRWLLERERLYRKILAIVAFAAIAGPLIATAAAPALGAGVSLNIGINGLYAMHIVWKLLVVSDALRRLHSDRRSGALEQLLVTPLPVAGIISAQLRRTFRLFLPSAVALAVGNYIFFQHHSIMGMRVVGIGGAIFLLIDARTLTWLAILQALKPARYSVAILKVAGVALLPPTLVLLLILWSGKRAFAAGEIDNLFVCWFGASAIYDLALMERAKRKLNRDFRELAAHAANPSTPKRPLPKVVQWMFLMEPTPARIQ